MALKDAYLKEFFKHIPRDQYPEYAEMVDRFVEAEFGHLSVDLAAMTLTKEAYRVLHRDTLKLLLDSLSKIKQDEETKKLEAAAA